MYFRLYIRRTEGVQACADEFLILDVASDEAKDADKLYDKVREAIDRFIETNEFKVMYTVQEELYHLRH